ncbi:MAG TPA: hypothetical protein VJK54_03590 [Chthoniobacterales bacterium]|nr:hypothetical protein [Chthoniobacterales bacterium]
MKFFTNFLLNSVVLLSATTLLAQVENKLQGAERVLPNNTTVNCDSSDKDLSCHLMMDPSYISEGAKALGFLGREEGIARALPVSVERNDIVNFVSSSSSVNHVFSDAELDRAAEDNDPISGSVNEYFEQEIMNNIYAKCAAKVATLSLQERQLADAGLTLSQAEAREWAIAKEAAEQKIGSAQTIYDRAVKETGEAKEAASNDYEIKKLYEKLVYAKLRTAQEVLPAITVRNTSQRAEAEAELARAVEEEIQAAEAFKIAKAAKALEAAVDMISKTPTLDNTAMTLLEPSESSVVNPVVLPKNICPILWYDEQIAIAAQKGQEALERVAAALAQLDKAVKEYEELGVQIQQKKGRLTDALPKTQEKIQTDIKELQTKRDTIALQKKQDSEKEVEKLEQAVTKAAEDTQKAKEAKEVPKIQVAQLVQNIKKTFEIEREEGGREDRIAKAIQDTDLKRTKRDKSIADVIACYEKSSKEAALIAADTTKGSASRGSRIARAAAAQDMIQEKNKAFFTRLEKATEQARAAAQQIIAVKVEAAFAQARQAKIASEEPCDKSRSDLAMMMDKWTSLLTCAAITSALTSSDRVSFYASVFVPLCTSAFSAASASASISAAVSAATSAYAYASAADFAYTSVSAYAAASAVAYVYTFISASAAASVIDDVVNDTKVFADLSRQYLTTTGQSSIGWSISAVREVATFTHVMTKCKEADFRWQESGSEEIITVAKEVFNVAKELNNEDAWKKAGATAQKAAFYFKDMSSQGMSREEAIQQRNYWTEEANLADVKALATSPCNDNWEAKHNRANSIMKMVREKIGSPVSQAMREFMLHSNETTLQTTGKSSIIAMTSAEAEEALETAEIFAKVATDAAKLGRDKKIDAVTQENVDWSVIVTREIVDFARAVADFKRAQKAALQL